MKKPESKFLNSILAVGMFFIFIGILLVLAFAGNSPDFAFWSIPVVIFFTGMVFLYSYIAFSKTPFKLFVSLCLSFYGVFSLMLVFQLFLVGVEKLWPVFVLLTSVSLFAAARSTKKIFTINYDLPALLLFVLGSIFLLFSFDVIKIPLGQLALFICPVTLILAGTFLVILFFHRKSLLEILPENMSEELKSEPNFSEEVE